MNRFLTVCRSSSFGLVSVILAALLVGGLLGCGGSSKQPGGSTVSAKEANEELEAIAPYLPEDLQFLTIARMGDLWSSPAWEEIEKTAPGMKKRLTRNWKMAGEGSELRPNDLSTIYLGLTLAKDPVRIVVAKQPLSTDALLEKYEPDEYREVKVGDATIYEEPSWRGRFEAVRADGPPPKPNFDGTGSAFCRVKPNVLVFGAGNQLKAALEKKDKKLPDGLRKALKGVDMTSPLIVVGSCKDTRGTAGPWDREPSMKMFLDSADTLTGQFKIGNTVSVSASLECSSEKAAKELRRLAEGGLAMIKLEKRAPKELAKLADEIDIKQDGARLKVNLDLPLARIAELFKAMDEDSGDEGYRKHRLSRLSEEAEDRDASKRANAAQEIGRIGAEPQVALPLLTKLLKDSDTKVRAAAAQTAARFGPDARELTPALAGLVRDENGDVRRRACESLGRIGGDEAAKALMSAMQDQETGVRQVAIGALGRTGPDAASAVPALTELVKGTDRDTGAAAAGALGSIGPKAKAAIPTLVEAALRGEGYVAEAAASALPKLGTDVLGPLQEGLTDKEPAARGKAAAAIGQFGKRGAPAVESLAKALGDDNGEVRTAAALALGRIGPAAKSAVPALVEAVKRDTRGALYALREIGPGAKEAVPALVARLEQGPSFEAELVMDTLTGIGPDAKEALPAIKKRLSGGGTGLGDAGPTIAVATAIWKIGGDGDGAVALLLPALQDAKPYSSDREKALKALGEMGPGAKKAVPALVELLKSAGPGVSMGDSLKENVIETLGKIGPGAKAAVPALLEVAKSNASYGRIAGKAVLALGQIGPDAAEAVPVLIRKLDRGEYEVKKNVPVALSQMGPAAKKAIPKLEQMIDSPFGVFRMQAATALWRLDGQVDRPVQIAIATLKEGDYASDDRMLALKVLGEMGPKAKSATKLLKLLSSDPNTEIREGAKAALAKIEA